MEGRATLQQNELSGLVGGHQVQVVWDPIKECMSFLVNYSWGGSASHSLTMIPPKQPMMDTDLSSPTPTRAIKRKSAQEQEEEEETKQPQVKKRKERVQLSKDISTIPPEIWESIFLMLPITSAFRVGKVCKLWRGVAETEGFWKRMVALHFGSPEFLMDFTWKQRFMYINKRMFRVYEEDTAAVRWAVVMGFEATPFMENHASYLADAVFAGHRKMVTQLIEELDDGEGCNDPLPIREAIATGDLGTYSLLWGSTKLRKMFKLPKKDGNKLMVLALHSEERELFDKVSRDWYGRGDVTLIDLAISNGWLDWATEELSKISNESKAYDRRLVYLNEGGEEETILRLGLDQLEAAGNIYRWILRTQFPRIERLLHLLQPILPKLPQNDLQLVFGHVLKNIEGDWRTKWHIPPLRRTANEKESSPYRILRILQTHLHDFNARFYGQQKHTPLHMAAEKCPDWVLQFLVEEWKANVDAVDISKRTPLMLAAMNGRTENVKYLISIGARKDLTDHEGHTATTLAMKNVHNDIAVLLG